MKETDIYIAFIDQHGGYCAPEYTVVPFNDYDNPEDWYVRVELDDDNTGHEDLLFSVHKLYHESGEETGELCFDEM